jgi:hypothetical protein
MYAGWVKETLVSLIRKYYSSSVLPPRASLSPHCPSPVLSRVVGRWHYGAFCCDHRCSATGDRWFGLHDQDTTLSPCCPHLGSSTRCLCTTSRRSSLRPRSARLAIAELCVHSPDLHSKSASLYLLPSIKCCPCSTPEIPHPCCDVAPPWSRQKFVFCVPTPIV